MKISERLITIASFINKDAFVMDVGADHGLLEKYLFENNKIKKMVAVENKEGPYNILKNNLKGYDVTILYSDGIKDITDDINTIVIAGMGGNLICSILKNDENKLENVDNIIVDAHTDIEIVRREICHLGYFIEKEKIVYENKKYYFVIKFVKGSKQIDDLEYEFGVNIVKDKLFEQYRNDQINKLELILKHKNRKDISQKLERLKSL